MSLDISNGQNSKDTTAGDEVDSVGSESLRWTVISNNEIPDDQVLKQPGSPIKMDQIRMIAYEQKWMEVKGEYLY